MEVCWLLCSGMALAALRQRAARLLVRGAEVLQVSGSRSMMECLSLIFAEASAELCMGL
jgi:hypothetical protein